MAKQSKSASSAKKRAGGKKSAAPKASPSAQESLRGEIEALLAKLDEQSLQFIKGQAEILVATAELAHTREETIKAIEKISQAQPAPGDRVVEPPAPAVSIERKQDNAFFIRAYGRKIFFNRQEMRQLARVAHAAGDAAEGARRLHTWLKRERGDFLLDTGVTGPGDPALRMIWEQIVTTYAAPQ